MSDLDGYMQLVHFTPNDSALACTLCGNVVWDFARHFRHFHPEDAIRSQEPPTGDAEDIGCGVITCAGCRKRVPLYVMRVMVAHRDEFGEYCGFSHTHSALTPSTAVQEPPTGETNA